MKKKRILALALTAVMALGLAACGNSSSNSSNNASGGSDAEGALPTVGVLI